MQRTVFSFDFVSMFKLVTDSMNRIENINKKLKKIAYYRDLFNEIKDETPPIKRWAEVLAIVGDYKKFDKSELLLERKILGIELWKYYSKYKDKKNKNGDTFEMIIRVLLIHIKSPHKESYTTMHSFFKLNGLHKN